MELKKLVKGFEAIDNGEKIGQIDFNINNGIMRITHTEVNGQYAGKGVAKELLNTAVEYARHKSIKIKPLCSYAAHVLQEDSYKDILE